MIAIEEVGGLTAATVSNSILYSGGENGKTVPEPSTLGLPLEYRGITPKLTGFIRDLGPET